MDPIRLISHHITMLQLEQYEIKRYMRSMLGRYMPPQNARQRPVWTIKLKTVTAVAFLYIACLIAFIGTITGIFGALLAGITAFLFLPLLLSLAVLSVKPADFLIKRCIITKARAMITAHSRLIVIGITGSYGKTTMKELLKIVLAEKFSVLATPESVNTPVGIAQFVRKKLTPQTEILIVEMGAYKKGDIRELCELARPAIAVLTGINEAHAERFGSIENTVQAKFEIAEYAKPEALIILNGEDKRVRTEYSHRIGNREALFYGGRGAQDLAPYHITNARFDEEGLKQSFEFENKNGESLYQLTTALLGEYAPETIMGVAIIAEHLGMSRAEITHGIAMARPISHRLEPFPARDGVLVIDDSYNGNPDGAREAIRTLSRFKNRRTLYVTPGLVEMGPKNTEIHRMLGIELASVADIVILIKNSATYFIAEGLKSAGFKSQNIMFFENAHAAHNALPAILKPGDIVLFQNDWPDNYL